MTRIEYHRGYGMDPDPRRALDEACASMLPGRIPALTLVFAAADYDRGALGDAVRRKIPGPVAGCTTAGQIDAMLGYIEGGILIVSIYSDELRAWPHLIPDIETFDFVASKALVQLLRDKTAGGMPLDPEHSFALLLVDGMSMMEEQLVATLHGTLDGVSLVGGSAGDGLRFEHTAVFASAGDGPASPGQPGSGPVPAFVEHAAVLVFVQTSLPFKTFRIQHFEPTGDRLVITEADESTRTVYEINGGPAAPEYARAVGMELTELSPQVFAAHPVMLRIGGEYFVRSIQRANPDGSLTFFCAIDAGLVLTVAKAGDLVRHMAIELESLAERVWGLSLILGFDCILRRLELVEKDKILLAGDVLSRYDFVGFSTYGEQFDGIHVNQTLTGVALGS